MSQKGKPQLKAVILSAIILLLITVSIFIASRLLTANYPAHSDVFYMGVECGALAAILLVCITLITLLLYHLVASLHGNRNSSHNNSQNSTNARA
jgi:hypothetical protein